MKKHLSKKKFALTLLSLLVAIVVVGGILLYNAGFYGLGAFYPVQENDFYASVPYEDYIDYSLVPSATAVDVRNYGASGDNSAIVNSRAINTAIKEVSKRGGGEVLISGGKYTSATINLQSNVTLFIEKDSALVSSRSFFDISTAFIRANNVENVCITGGGKVLGEGDFFVKPPKNTSESEPTAVSDIRLMKEEYWSRIRFGKLGRPKYMMWFEDCKNVTVNNIALENSPDWTLCVEKSDGAVIENLIINNNRRVANTDGIDIMASSNVSVSHTFISTADDGIVLKNPTGNAMSGIRIYDCAVSTRTNAFKIGSETRGDISNVTVSNFYAFSEDVYPGGISGISIESMDGARVSGISITDFKTKNITCPLFVRLGNRNRYLTGSWKGTVANVTISNFTAENAELPSIITGVSNGKNKVIYVENIVLNNFTVSYRECPEVVILPESVPEYATEYPENWDFKDVPAYGLYARHVKGLNISSFAVTPRSQNTRELLFYEDIL
jgi:polygalacturonase